MFDVAMPILLAIGMLDAILKSEIRAFNAQVYTLSTLHMWWTLSILYIRMLWDLWRDV
jgi:hypothetical protein